MFQLIVYIPLIWIQFTRFLCIPVRWLGDILEDAGELIASNINHRLLRIAVYALTLIEVGFFVSYCMNNNNIPDIVLTVVGCSPIGGFLDFYSITSNVDVTASHFWITSGVLWILSMSLDKLLEKIETPVILSFVASIAFTLFYSSIVGRVYDAVVLRISNRMNVLMNSNLTALSIVDALPLLLAVPVLVFAIISGLWVTVSMCNDVASFMFFFVICWAVFPQIFTNNNLMFILVSIFVVIYIVARKWIDSQEEDEYESLSIFHLLLFDSIGESNILAILFFLYSLFGVWVFFTILIALLFPEWALILFDTSNLS